MPDFPLLLKRIISDGRLSNIERKVIDGTIARDEFRAADVQKLRLALQGAYDVLETSDETRPLLKARIETLTTIAALAPKEDTGGTTCFAAGTLVTMADGRLRAIEHVAVGELVRSFDGERLCAEPVEATFAHHPHESRGALVRLNGTLVTSDHPLFHQGQIIASGEASIGTPVVAFAGDGLRDARITHVEHRAAHIPTYNLCVRRAHRFFAGGMLFWD